MAKQQVLQGIGLVIIGDEILSARRQDKHFNHAVEVLADRGLTLAWAKYLGDSEQLLVDTFEQIKQSPYLCFSFGGIGATPDDRTRQAMAKAHHVSLYRHPDAVHQIEQRFGEEAYPKRILMAELPEGSSIIPNPYNQIPGFYLDHIHCLPGFPEMAWPMMEWVLNERYPDMRAEKPVLYRLFIHDIRESELIDPMEQLQARYPEVKISSLPRFLEGGGYRVEMGVTGIESLAKPTFDELRHILNDVGIVFSED